MPALQEKPIESAINKLVMGLEKEQMGGTSEN